MSTTELLEQVRALPARERQKFVLGVLALEETPPTESSDEVDEQVHQHEAAAAGAQEGGQQNRGHLPDEAGSRPGGSPGASEGRAEPWTAGAVTAFSSVSSINCG